MVLSERHRTAHLPYAQLFRAMAYSHIPILALIGGIGCGKSALAGWLAGQARACIVDADAVGHAVLRRPQVSRQLVEAFGSEILTDDGQVDRSALARRVFGNTPAQLSARQRLEAIVHPVMREDFEDAFEAARASGEFDLIIFDAAILLESGWKDAAEVIAFIDVPFAERLRRVASRGWTEGQLRQRESSQWPLEKKRAAADVVIDNSGNLEVAGQQLQAYLLDRGFLPAPLSATDQLIH